MPKILPGAGNRNVYYSNVGTGKTLPDQKKSPANTLPYKVSEQAQQAINHDYRAEKAKARLQLQLANRRAQLNAQEANPLSAAVMLFALGQFVRLPR